MRVKSYRARRPTGSARSTGPKVGGAREVREGRRVKREVAPRLESLGNPGGARVPVSSDPAQASRKKALLEASRVGTGGAGREDGAPTPPEARADRPRDDCQRVSGTRGRSRGRHSPSSGPARSGPPTAVRRPPPPLATALPPPASRPSSVARLFRSRRALSGRERRK